MLGVFRDCFAATCPALEQPRCFPLLSSKQQTVDRLGDTTSVYRSGGTYTSNRRSWEGIPRCLTTGFKGGTNWLSNRAREYRRKHTIPVSLQIGFQKFINLSTYYAYITPLNCPY